MPSWLVSILISLAVSLGKVGLQWLITKFPGIPAYVVTAVETILDGTAQHSAAVEQALAEHKARV